MNKKLLCLFCILLILTCGFVYANDNNTTDWKHQTKTLLQMNHKRLQQAVELEISRSVMDIMGIALI